MMNQEKYVFWLNHTDSSTRHELFKLQNNTDEINDRFIKELEFGTGGLRGLVGAGTNRINIYTVRKVSQGLADYLIKQGEDSKQRGIVIAYDSRNQSAIFAIEAAQVFAGNGIKVHLFDELRPTPVLSFAIRYLHAAAGVMITASHNPKEYNGYKVYGADGAQMIPDDTNAIAREINKISDFTQAMFLDSEVAKSNGLIQIIGNDIDNAYILSLKSLIMNPCLIKQYGGDVKIMYTPLHGTGGKMVGRILSETGFENVRMVESQMKPDGDFPSLKVTLNPEDNVVYRHALKLAKETDVDLILATDPDCDRVGVMIKKNKKHYVLLNGNQAGALMLDYILSAKQENGTLLANSFVAKTIVTTHMAQAIAERFHVEIAETLTGFKYIGELIKQWHDRGDKTFIFGMEDSCGYLFGTAVRDKDGVIGCMLMAETAAWYKSKRLSLYDGLKRLEEKYGCFKSTLISYSLRGEKRLSDLTPGHDTLRKLGVTAVSNYREQKRYDLVSGGYTTLELPRSEVMYYELNDGWFCIRPSGTEAKMKLYFEVWSNNDKTAETKLRKLIKRVVKAINHKEKKLAH